MVSRKDGFRNPSGELLQSVREELPDLGIHTLKESSIFLRQIIENPPALAMTSFCQLKNDDPSVPRRSAPPQKTDIQQALGEPAGRALLKVESISQLCDRQGSKLEEYLKSMALAY